MKRLEIAQLMYKTEFASVEMKTLSKYVQIMMCEYRGKNCQFVEKVKPVSTFRAEVKKARS